MLIWVSFFTVLTLALGEHQEAPRSGILFRRPRSDDSQGWENVVNGLSLQLSQLSAQVTALQNQQSQLQAKMAASQKQVAFLASNHADPFNVAARGTLVYDHADVNVGKAYDPASGFFTAPVSGLYVFHITCLQADADEDIGVLVDGTQRCSCYTASAGMGAGMATVHMNAGQKAWVRLFRSTARNVRGYYYNAFAGFLVQPDS